MRKACTLLRTLPRVNYDSGSLHVAFGFHCHQEDIPKAHCAGTYSNRHNSMKLLPRDAKSVECVFETEYRFKPSFIHGDDVVTTESVGAQIEQVNENDSFLISVQPRRRAERRTCRSRPIPDLVKTNPNRILEWHQTGTANNRCIDLNKTTHQIGVANPSFKGCKFAHLAAIRVVVFCGLHVVLICREPQLFTCQGESAVRAKTISAACVCGQPEITFLEPRYGRKIIRTSVRVAAEMKIPVAHKLTCQRSKSVRSFGV